MQFEREYGGAGANKRIRECAGSGPEVEHEIAAANVGVVDETLRPMPMKLVPSPSCEFPGHGGPS